MVTKFPSSAFGHQYWIDLLATDDISRLTRSLPDQCVTIIDDIRNRGSITDFEFESLNLYPDHMVVGETLKSDVFFLPQLVDMLDEKGRTLSLDWASIGNLNQVCPTMTHPKILLDQPRRDWLISHPNLTVVARGKASGFYWLVSEPDVDFHQAIVRFSQHYSGSSYGEQLQTLTENGWWTLAYSWLDSYWGALDELTLSKVTVQAASWYLCKHPDQSQMNKLAFQILTRYENRIGYLLRGKAPLEVYRYIRDLVDTMSETSMETRLKILASLFDQHPLSTQAGKIMDIFRGERYVSEAIGLTILRQFECESSPSPRFVKNLLTVCDQDPNQLAWITLQEGYHTQKPALAGQVLVYLEHHFKLSMHELYFYIDTHIRSNDLADFVNTVLIDECRFNCHTLSVFTAKFPRLGEHLKTTYQANQDLGIEEVVKSLPGQLDVTYPSTHISDLIFRNLHKFRSHHLVRFYMSSRFTPSDLLGPFLNSDQSMSCYVTLQELAFEYAKNLVESHQSDFPIVQRIKTASSILNDWGLILDLGPMTYDIAIQRGTCLGMIHFVKRWPRIYDACLRQFFDKLVEGDALIPLIERLPINLLDFEARYGHYLTAEQQQTFEAGKRAMGRFLMMAVRQNLWQEVVQYLHLGVTLVRDEHQQQDQILMPLKKAMQIQETEILQVAGNVPHLISIAQHRGLSLQDLLMGWIRCQNPLSTTNLSAVQSEWLQAWRNLGGSCHTVWTNLPDDDPYKLTVRRLFSRDERLQIRDDQSAKQDDARSQKRRRV